MNDRVADFAETYSKMTDEQLLRVLSDEKSLVDAARAALQTEVQRRDLASPADTGNALRGQTETLWERQLNPEGVGGWLALWCVSVALIGPLYFFFHASEQIAQTSLTLVMFGSQSWVGVVFNCDSFVCLCGQAICAEDGIHILPTVGSCRGFGLCPHRLVCPSCGNESGV